MKTASAFHADIHPTETSLKVLDRVLPALRVVPAVTRISPLATAEEMREVKKIIPSKGLSSWKTFLMSKPASCCASV